MSFKRFALVFVAFTSGVASCSDPASPRTPLATVAVQLDTVRAERLPAGRGMWMRFTVPVTIRNADRTSVTFVYCASSLEVQEVETWRGVWSPVCSLTGPSTPFTILPGETRQVVFEVTAALGGPGAPEWENDSVVGRYRFSVGVMTAGTSGLIPHTPSSSFLLVDQP
jgi:hypothetical protein